MEDILVPLVIFGGATAVAIAFSPIGRAIAARISARAVVAETDPALLADLDDMRAQLSELQERVDFGERLMSKDRDAKALEPGAGA